MIRLVVDGKPIYQFCSGDVFFVLDENGVHISIAAVWMYSCLVEALLFGGHS